MTDITSTPLDPDGVRAVIKESFPGLIPKKTDALNGTEFQVKVWEYVLVISLTTYRIVKADKGGTAIVRFVRKADRTTRLWQEKVDDLEGLRKQVENARRTLKGIVAAIEIACTDRPPGGLQADSMFEED